MPPKTVKPARNLRTFSAVGVTSTVTLAAAVAAALFVGGSHSAPPPSLPASVTGGMNTPRYSVVTFSWRLVPDATGYRLWLDGVPGVLQNAPAYVKPLAGQPAPTTSTSLPVSCGVKHRINEQPFNNKGFAALVPPLYVTPPCSTATT